jgi:ketosteroid isomerase-like protein
MSQANVDLVRKSLETYRATGEFEEQDVAPDFAWDMSKFAGWLEQQVYEGSAGARRFLADWLDAWEDWELEAEAFHDAGEKVLATMHQRGRSKASGLAVDMYFAMVWTVRGDGMITRMEMYADPAEAFEAVGLAQ